MTEKPERQALSEYLDDWQSRFGRSQLLSFLGPGILEILDSIPYYVLLIDQHHRILLANKATRDQLGVEPQDITGEFCPRAIHGLKEGESYPGCPLEEAVATQEPVEKDHFDENTGRWMRIAMYPSGAWTVSGERIYLHMLQDITEQKQMEKEIEELRAANRQLSERLNQRQA